GTYLQDVRLSRYQEISPLIEADIYDVLASKTAVKKRNSYGGTGFDQIHIAIANAKKTL
ncbi:argininosuccinate lyase, partial [Escherichia coli]|nr:argininosuccinate lyase [Escherichia coli]